MIRKRWLWLSVATAFILSWAIGAEKRDYARPVCPDKLRTELERIRDGILRSHPVPECRISAAEWEQKYQEIRESLQTPLTPEQFWVRAVPLVALLQDSHTLLAFPFPPPETRLLLPADLVRTRDGVALGMTYQPELNPYGGFPLRAINGRPVDEMVKTFFPLMAGETEGARWTALESDMPKVLWSYLYPQEDSFRFTMADGREIEVKGATWVAMKNQRGSRRQQDKRFWQPAGKAAWVRLKNLADPALEKEWPRALKEIQRAGLSPLILDLRGNPGGNTEYAEGIAASLLGKPVRFLPVVTVRASAAFRQQMKQRIPRLLRFLPLEKLHPQGRAVMGTPEGGLVTIQDKNAPTPPLGGETFTGEVRILMDGATCSAATYLAREIQLRQRGLLMGSEAGGAADGLFGEPLRVDLPGVGLFAQIPSMILTRDGQIPSGARPALEPDVPLYADPCREARGGDSILQAAVAYSIDR